MMKVEIRRFWSKEWMNSASVGDVKIAATAWMGLAFCFGALFGFILV